MNQYPPQGQHSPAKPPVAKPLPVKPPVAKPIPPANPQVVLPPQATLPPQPAASSPQPFAIQLESRGTVEAKSIPPRKKSNIGGIVGLAVISILCMVALGGAAYVLTRPEQVELAEAGDKPKKAKKNVETKPVEVPAVTPAARDEKPIELQPETDQNQMLVVPPVESEPMPTAPRPMPMPAVSMTVPPSSDSPSSTPEVTTPEPPQDEVVETLVELFKSKTLLSKKEYPRLRKVFADRAEKNYAAQMKQGLGDDFEEAQAWFAEHSDIKEELLLAIREGDEIAAVFKIFNDLRKQFPEKIVPYANLAIATAVVWDQPERGIYEYDHHARRCKANLSPQTPAFAENFAYLVKAEPVMQGRIQYVPWEFLIHVVNHRTPLEERGWAVQGYLGSRVMFGKCYHDVPYDHVMLNTHSEQANLNGKDYTLPNLKAFGGVCAMQADYASRVGKSIGVPAEYVRGEAAGGDLHAWVMWVELKTATPTGLVFTLESHGRYRGDKYYVGQLDDPQTGRDITDRQLELRLQTVGLDTIAKRQTSLVMQEFGALREQAELDTPASLTLLDQIIAASPGNEAAWKEVAAVVKEEAGNKAYSQQILPMFDKLFRTFGRVPDFTLEVFDDLAAYQPDSKQRIKLYERLVQLYEQCGRPDLACEARLRMVDLQLENDQSLEAVNGLAFTAKKFADEGRYVPKLIDKIELICVGKPELQVAMVQFWTQLLPLIPQMRDDSPSPYAMRMFERATEVFLANNQPQLAQAAQAELANIRAGRGRKPLRNGG